MKKLLSALAAAMSLGAPAVASAEQWTFGPFSVNAFDGYQYKQGRSPAVYENPVGSVALVTVHVLQGTPREDQLEAVLANASKYARSTFEAAAAKFGKPGHPYLEQRLPSGDTLASLPVITKDAGVTGYLLQYAVISGVGHLAILTVEGSGDGSPVEAKLMPAIRSAKFQR